MEARVGNPRGIGAGAASGATGPGGIFGDTRIRAGGAGTLARYGAPQHGTAPLGSKTVTVDQAYVDGLWSQIHEFNGEFLRRNAQLGELNQEKDRLANEGNFLRAEIGALGGNIDALNARNDGLLGQIANLTVELGATQTDKERLEREISNLTGQLDANLTTIQGLNDQKVSLEGRNFQLETDLGGLRAQIPQLRQDMDVLRGRLDSVEAENEGLRSGKGNFDGTIYHLQTQLNQANGQLEIINKSLSDEIGKNKANADTITHLHQELGEANHAIEAAIHDIENRLLGILKPGGGRSGAIQRIVHSERSQVGRLKEILGVALGKIQSLKSKRSAARTEVHDLAATLRADRRKYERDVQRMEIAEKSAVASASHLRSAQAENADLRGQVAATQAENADLWGRVTATQAENANLQAQVARMQAQLAQYEAELRRAAAEKSALAQALADSGISMT